MDVNFKKSAEWNDPRLLHSKNEHIALAIF